MPTLSFRIKKRLDASVVLVLVREDGSSTGSIGLPGGYGPRAIPRAAIWQNANRVVRFRYLCR
jgi:hypothetical protein